MCLQLMGIWHTFTLNIINMLYIMYLADNPKITATGQVLLTINEHIFIGIGIRGKQLYKVNTQMILIDDNKLKKNFLKMRIGDDVRIEL